MINPTTGLEDPNYKPPAPTDFFGSAKVVNNAGKVAGALGQLYNPITGQYEAKPTLSASVTPLNMTIPGPTVATPKNPIVDKEKVGVTTPVTMDLTRENFVNTLAKDPTKMTEQDKEFIRKVNARRALGEDLGKIFGETSTTTPVTSPTIPNAPTSTEAIATKKGELATATSGLVDSKQKELDAQLSKRKSELEALGAKQLQAAQSAMSSSGFGRSTVNADQQASIQKNVNDTIAAEQARAAQEIAIFKAQQEGADAKTIAGMQSQLDEYTQNVQELAFNNAKEVAKLNAANNIKGEEALGAFLSALTGDTKKKIDEAGYDEKLSSKLGYAVDKFGKPLMVDGKKLEFTTPGISDAVESYASEIFKGNANISSVPDEQRDAVINRVAGMRGEAKTSTSSVNEFKAERILKTVLKRTIDKQKDSAYMGLVGNMLDKGYTEDQIYQELGAADLTKTDFVAGNQKLFDDMQKDTKDYSDMRGSYKNMQAIVDQSIAQGDAKSKASADQALVTLFNKMLDPGSVVREGEYDRTAQGQSILSQAEGYLNRLTQGGAPITDETRKDMVRIAEIMFKQAESGIKLRKNTYGQIATDVGGDPAFVERYFDGQINSNATKITNNQQEIDQIKSIFGGGTTTQPSTAKELKSLSGKTFKINFNQPEQSGSKTELKDLTSERGKSIPNTRNVGKDLNNPGNLTVGGKADSLASGYVTVTGLDGVTRKFLTFPSKDAGYEAVKTDLQAKIEGKSRYVKLTDSLEKLLDVWVGGKGAGSGYKETVAKNSGYALNTPVDGLDVDKILKGIKIAEGA